MTSTTPLLDALNERSIYAYERRDTSELPGLRVLGAVMAVQGIAENGGLVGGAIENLFFNENLQAVDDAVAGLQWLGLADVAALVGRARLAYLRFRPTGYEELSPQDEVLWEELDASFFEIAPLARLEAAVAVRLQDIAPELVSS